MSVAMYGLLTGAAALAIIFLALHHRPRLLTPIFGLTLFVFLAVTVDLQAGFKPAWMEWRLVDEADVIAVHPVPHEAIYLVLALESGPHCYRFPWEARKARELEEAGKGKRGAKIINPFGWQRPYEVMKNDPPPLPEKE